MTLLAAAATAGYLSGWLLITAAALMWVAGYTAACAVWPFGHCRRCDGSGKRMSPSGRAFRLCPKCKGTGRRLRVGRRVFNHLRNQHDEANR